MSRYAQALSVMEFKVQDVDFELKPVKGDNRRLRKILQNPAYEKNNAAKMDAIEEFIINLLKRDMPPADKQEEEELELFVEQNFMTFYQEVMIQFKWTTRDELEQVKDKSLKKSIDAS